MKQTLLGGIVGGVILFIWSFLAWVILPLHEPTLHRIKDEDAVRTMLQSTIDTKAVYIVPHGPDNKSDQAAMSAWEQKMKQGPTGLIIFDPQGSDPMMASQMVSGILIDILTGILIAWFLKRSTALASTYVARVAYCGMLGIFIAVISHLTAWNWMGFPADYTTAMIVDTLISMVLAGLGIAAIVKTRDAVQSASPA